MTIQDTLNARRSRHGDFNARAEIAQDLKARFFEAKSREAFPLAAQVQALEVIFDKLARIAAGDDTFDDHWHDIAGYATLGEMAVKAFVNGKPHEEPKRRPGLQESVCA